MDQREATRRTTIKSRTEGRLRLHWSWSLWPAAIAAYALAIHGWREAILDVLVVAAVYVGVLLHESVQYLCARRIRLHLRTLTLYPFWAVAQWTPLSDRPARERSLAATGPLVLAMLAIMMGAALALQGVRIAWPERLVEPSADVVLVRIFWALVVLTGFHLLPVLPVDGGRFVRASLALRSSRTRATEAVAVASTALAGVLLTLAILWLRSPLVAGTAVLMFLATQQDLDSARRLDRLRQRSRRRPAAPTLLVPTEQIVTPDCRPDEPHFSGFTWNARSQLWIEWHDGRPIAASALIGEARP